MVHYGILMKTIGIYVMVSIWFLVTVLHGDPGTRRRGYNKQGI